MNKALALILAPQTNEEEVRGRQERRKKLKNKGKGRKPQGPGFKTNQSTTAMSHDLESYSHSVFVTPFVAVMNLFWLTL